MNWWPQKQHEQLAALSDYLVGSTWQRCLQNFKFDTWGQREEIGRFQARSQRSLAWIVAYALRGVGSRFMLQCSPCTRWDEEEEDERCD
jgi:hypothetical protein